MKKIIFILVISYSIVFGDSCNYIYDKYKLDPEIKSIKGWRRVCKNHKLNNYIDSYITESDKKTLCSCLINRTDESSDRSVTTFMK